MIVFLSTFRYNLREDNTAYVFCYSRLISGLSIKEKGVTHMAFDGLVISNIVHELNQTLFNARISKIAQPESDELLFTLKGTNGQHRLAISSTCI